MALEALLPSEIARLIYGYLMEEKCIETAKTFLNESPNLQECRNVLSYGKHFTTRVCGYALWDILEKFCIINSIVQEKIDKCDNTDKLRHCSDLINQIKLLIEEYKGHKFLTNIVTTPTQNQSTVTNESFVKSHRRHSSSKDEDEVKHIEETPDKGFKTHTETNFSPIQNSYKTETTLLKNLPGYIKDLQTEQCETLKLKSPRKSREISKIDNILQSEELHENVILQEIKNKNHHLPDQSRLDKSTMTNRIEENLKNNKYSQIQAGNICSNDLQVSPTDECIELLSDLTLELLNRTEIQEIIADNINRILEPVKSNLHNKSNEDSKEELNKSFILEFNKAIEVAVNKTENDPEFLDLLNEIIPKGEEILNTDQIELNNRNVNKFQKVELVSKEKVTENSIDIKTISSQMFDQSTCYVLDIQNTNKIMNVEHADLSNTDKCVIESTEVKQVDLIKKNSKIPVSDARNSLLNPEKYMKSPYIDLNPIESSTVQQKSLYKANNLFSYNNITSTPIKTSASIQNLDTYDWFSTQELLKPNILYQKDDTAMPSKTNTYTACETIVTTVASHISPIISKEQTLHTPDTHSPKMKVSNSISSAFPINIVSKYKTPFSQKSSEVLDELLNLHSSQKSNGNIDNLSPLLKDNNEYNKYFSIESIMLYGMDNNLSTVKTPLIIPEIEVEDSITLTGTGLSPFLKIHKKSTETTDNLNEKNDEKVKYLGNRQSDELTSSDEKNYLTKKPDESHIIVEKNSKEIFTNLRYVNR
ncbi:PREDICTED: uncharacterized protein LOC105361669 [Ceratosolen solmsi marchali]|uniref:Uncharacterized protein LOC105361669 n=1 Tax=Ceratosolen solmsi marchali TaxID=326594 RepID=A0AAJ7DUU1_9HYME|nr:PREDICTED: uncharacterized protein LOC105361669 [Ceratosolen solmsi marchali]